LSQSLGKDPVLMDFWYIEASPGAIFLSTP
jgi:hypothetical protein